MTSEMDNFDADANLYIESLYPIVLLERLDAAAVAAGMEDGQVADSHADSEATMKQLDCRGQRKTMRPRLEMNGQDTEDARASRDELVELRRRLHDSGLELEKSRKEADLLRASNARLEAALRQERESFEQQLEFLRQEERRNRGPCEDASSAAPCVRAGKRRYQQDTDLYSAMAYTVRQEQCGFLHLHDLDPERGQFVRLRNTSPDAEAAIGGWTLRLECDGAETVYKFPAKAALAPLAEATVWSSDAGVAHNPPTDFVTKSKGCGQGENIRVRLLDTQEKEMASRHMVLDRSKLAGIKRLRGSESTDRCSVM